MLLGEIFERFIQDAPIPVLFRLFLLRALDPQELDRTFQQHAQSQYTRELLFSHVVKVMALAVFKVHSSLRQAYFHSQQELLVSLSALYEKLQGTEPGVCRGFVVNSAGRLRVVIAQVHGELKSPLPGYRVKIVDGNHLAGAEHRPKVTREVAAAILPGQTLVVLDAQTQLVVDVIPCEDGHAQERSLVGAVLEGVESGDLWIADRNFCCRSFVFGVVGRHGSFLVRQHQTSLPWEATGDWTDCGQCESGRVQEQQIRLLPAAGDETEAISARRIRLVLDQATEGGEIELFLVTNVLETETTGAELVNLYRKRWTIENAFQTLTCALKCEVNTLAYPKAALLGFCVALAGYNALMAVRAAIRAAHGAEEVEGKISNYGMMEDISSTTKGMMIALPEKAWKAFDQIGDEAFGEQVLEIAHQVQLWRYPLGKRGAKRPRPPRTMEKGKPHVSMAKLLKDQK